MAKAKKLPSGKWRARATWVDRNGTQHSKSFSALTKKDAEYAAAQFLLEKQEDESDDCTVDQAISRYIEHNRNKFSPSTLRSYCQMQKNYYDDIAHIKISELKSRDINIYINKISAIRSPKTVRNVYGLFIAAVRYVNPYKILNVKLPEKEVITYSLPTDEQVKQLIEKSDRNLKVSILLASIGTLRRGEICAIKYSDINGTTIHVHADMVHTPDNKWFYKQTPKTGSSDRYVQFPQKVIDEIGEGKPDDFIVKLCPDTITKKYIDLRNSLGITCRFHDLRHYAASVMHALGVPDQYIMERGGWSSDQTLKAVYRNTLSNESKKFSDQTNAHFENMF